MGGGRRVGRWYWDEGLQCVWIGGGHQVVSRQTGCGMGLLIYSLPRILPPYLDCSGQLHGRPPLSSPQAPPLSPPPPHLCCSTKPRSTNGLDCHHGINMSASQDVLVANITHGMTCFHDLTVFNFTVCVCVEGRGGGGERGMPPSRQRRGLLP